MFLAFWNIHRICKIMFAVGLKKVTVLKIILAPMLLPSCSGYLQILLVTFRSHHLVGIRIQFGFTLSNST